jgi:hypothetical protein
MRIGLIGNMNNNNFSMLRYMRNIGVDAHLLLFSDDCKFHNEHFSPECDTWNIEEWQEFIHTTKIPNSPFSAIGFPLSLLISLKSKFYYYFGFQEYYFQTVSKKDILREFANFDYLIGSGISPAVLYRIGRKLDIFYPYSPNIEFFNAGYFLNLINSKSLLPKLIYNKIREKQINAIIDSKKIIISDIGVTLDSLTNLGIKPKILPIPMVYNVETFPYEPPTFFLKKLFEQLNSSSLSVLHSARLSWVNKKGFSQDEWQIQNKNSDWLFIAVSKFIKIRPSVNLKIFVIEYGPDISETKQLINELGLTDIVIWLPKMKRKEIVWILSQVTIGVGEFIQSHGIMWGGTGWESLAYGKPLMQTFNFEKNEFINSYGFPPPPLLDVKDSNDIVNHLLTFSDNPRLTQIYKHDVLDWFNSYNGMGLARKWVDEIC